MQNPDSAAIQAFMQGQVRCWNAHDKPGLMALYRQMAPLALDIQYAGREPQADGWRVIEEMYDKHNAQFRLEVVTTVYNGLEAAAHHRNCIVGTEMVIESIETYRFGVGTLHVRYHLLPPQAGALDLAQFRGFAAKPNAAAP